MDKEHVFEEKKRIGKLSQIREIVFGAQDGLLVPLGVVSSVAGAFSNNHIVIVAGIAEALAGSFSMATGAYLASQAEAQVFKAEVEKEEHEIKKNPEKEKEELVTLFAHEGVEKEDAITIVTLLAKSKQAFLTTSAQKELGIEPDPLGNAYQDGLYVGLSYFVTAIIPIFPYFILPSQKAIFLSMGLTLVALFCIGVLKAKFAGLSYVKSGLQVLLIGAISGIGGYVIGVYLPHILGIR